MVVDGGEILWACAARNMDGVYFSSISVDCEQKGAFTENLLESCRLEYGLDFVAGSNKGFKIRLDHEPKNMAVDYSVDEGGRKYWEVSITQ